MNTRWCLDELYTSFDSAEFKNDFEAMKLAVAEIGVWAAENLKKTNVSDEEAAAIIEKYINGKNDFSKYYMLAYYANLVASADTQDEAANKYVDLFRNAVTDLTGPAVMFSKFVGQCNLEKVLAVSEVCRKHEFMIREAKQQAQYLLAEDVEVALAKFKTTASNAWNIMKEGLTSTLMMDVDVNGEIKTLPLSAVRSLAHDADKTVRKNAYEAEIKAYEKVEKPVAAALNSIKGEVLTECTLRGYASPLDMTLNDSRMSRKTLDAMMGSIKQYLPSLRRFYAKKAQLLGHEKYLPYYDLFAPVGNVNMRFTYEESMDYIVKNFNIFSPEMGSFAKKAFEERWLDAEPREGKRGGAFCMNIHPIKQSRVLSNFTGSLNDVATLAHELGHAWHGHCLNDETFINAGYPMPIAETASTFCETLIFDSAAKTATDSEKLVVLEGQLTDATQVIVDIYARYVFETNLFKQREKGPLSVNEIKELMVAAQKEAYGDSLDPTTPHPYMWINKPHYYMPSRNFYNFPYAYGLMFALGLYSEFLKTGSAFVPKYNSLLSVTGRMSLEEIGREAEIDVTSKDFWVSSLKLIEKKVDEFCAH